MLGESLALACALTWAVSVILFKQSERVSPQGLNLFKNLVAIVLLVITLPLLGQGIDFGRSQEDWWRLCISGVVGIAISDTIYFVALRRLGPALLAVVECVYAPFVVTLAILFLGERPGTGFAVGATLIVAGIVTVSTDARAANVGSLTSREQWRGFAIAIFGFACLAAGVVVAKPALDRGALVEVTLIRLLAGVTAQLAWIFVVPGGRAALEVLRPSRVWWTLVPASILGSYVSMLLWLGGFKWASASVASVLNQLTTVFVVVLARMFLDEPITARRATGGAIAFAGAVLVVV